jgi:carbonic anhydrase
MTSEQALKRLVTGNLRYVAGTPKHNKVSRILRTNLHRMGQKPYAVIVGCSDSRVPVELIFDTGPGELFVIRSAGNVVGPIGEGSMEFAITEFQTPLIIVLGHQNCGAVHAAVDGGDFPPSIQAFLQEIRACMPTNAGENKYEVCEDAHIRQTLAKIGGYPFVSKAVSEGALHLAAAKYSLETGLVSFFE